MLKVSSVNRRVLLRNTALSIALALSAAALSTATVQAKTLKFVPEADLRSLDPIWTTAYITRNHGYMVFDTLFGIDGSYRAQPQMVEGIALEQVIGLLAAHFDLG